MAAALYLLVVGHFKDSDVGWNLLGALNHLRIENDNLRSVNSQLKSWSENSKALVKTLK